MANVMEVKSEMQDQSDITETNGLFVTIMQSNVCWIRATATRQLRDATLADDAVQEVFLALWSQYPEIPKDGQHLHCWLAKTTQYVCSSLRRARMRQMASERKADKVRATAGRLAEEHANNEQLFEIDKAMGRLPAADRDMLVARYYKGYSTLEIARYFRITNAATRKRFSRNLEWLRAEICRGKSQKAREHSELPSVAGLAKAPVRKL